MVEHRSSQYAQCMHTSEHLLCLPSFKKRFSITGEAYRSFSCIDDRSQDRCKITESLTRIQPSSSHRVLRRQRSRLRRATPPHRRARYNDASEDDNAGQTRQRPKGDTARKPAKSWRPTKTGSAHHSKQSRPRCRDCKPASAVETIARGRCPGLAISRAGSADCIGRSVRGVETLARMDFGVAFCRRMGALYGHSVGACFVDPSRAR
ncbi:hypothetical protein C8Q77DRAFT_563886 [Trametes polyzona]|nr:hypothetical protein C8Q77DRAFT_563886 [Trametes polyzona]